MNSAQPDPALRTTLSRHLYRTDRRAALRFFSLLLILSGSAMLLLLGHVPLLDNNEGMYASIGAQMLRDGDWVIPHFNGVTYLEKPPLLYWATAISLSLFGEHAWAARLPSALAGMGCIIAVGCWVARRQSLEQGLISGALLGSMAGYVLLSRTLLFDPLLTLWFTLALLLAWDARPGDRFGPSLAAICLALAVLTKGLLAVVLFGGILLSASLWCREARPLRALLHPLPLLVFIAVAAPWHLLAAQRDADFLWFYFVNEHWLRFLGQRLPYDYYGGPWWYYLPRLLLLSLPWSPLLLMRPGQPWPQWARLACCACLVPLLFFSLSRAKANYYAVLILPWIAMLAGHVLYTRQASLARQWKYWHLAILLLALGLLWGGILQINSARPVLTGLLLSLAMLAISALAISLGKRLRWLCTAQLAILIPLSAVTLAASPHWKASSAPDLAILQSRHPQADLLLFGKLESSSALAFYHPEPLRMVDSSSSDLYFGRMRGERPELFLDAATAEKQLRQGASLLVSRHDGKRFRHHPLSRQLVLLDESGMLSLYRWPEPPPGD
ncbi:glycosyltransferase family 39 protein [Pseudomonas sp. CAN2814]|uniref:ArnT family glycosyltransferase n=1 Tax=Pseudomonas sp. CAN1 TaxID=3046726 RepID=UPI0026470024|nr:glycosyltransferase family 39 protein [Pseudomonas sp. CAN1]MDN6856539.1 glycosyltransferase family 39 protein [Pseudomonas sp. CAN1]